MQNLIHGLGLLGSGPALVYLFSGALIGMVAGVIPGLSGVTILSIILIFINHMNLTGTLCLFIGSECGSFYAASVSAILLNTPSHPESFPITFDGYPMARKGQPGRALGLSACSTFVGGLLGCGVLVAFLPVIDYLPQVFHPPEYLALVTLAMLMVGTLGADSVFKAVVSAGAGLMISSIGPSPITGTFRYTFGAVGLFNGISLVALALGMFAIPQMVMVFGTGTATARQDMNGQELGDVEMVEITKGYGRQLIGGIFETFKYWGVLLQSGIIGGLSGIIPAIGGFEGNYLSYGIARQTSRKSRRELYGTGIPEGIIAPEGSSLAKEAGHKIPLIGLGIPGGISGALFIGALTIKGLHTGSGFQTAYPNITGEIVWIMALSGLIGTAAGVLIGPQIARITKVPGPLLVPFVFAVSASGPFLIDIEFFAVIALLIFSVLGLGLRRLKYPLGSFSLGLVLGPTFETNIYLTRKIYPGVSLLTKRPIADGIFLLAIIVLVTKFFELHNEAKKRKALLQEELAHLDDPLQRANANRDQQRRLAPYPLLAPIMSAFLLGVSLFFVIFGFTHFSFIDGATPVIGGLCVAIPTAIFLPRPIYRYKLYRKARSEVSLARGTSTDMPEPDIVSNAVSPPDEGTLGALSPSAGLVEAAKALTETMTVSPVATPAPEIREKSWRSHGQYRREIVAYGWLFGLVGLCWLFGFPIATAIFMAAYGLTSTRRYLRKLHQRLIFTLVSTALIWAITYEMFNLTNTLFTPKINL